MKNSFVGLFRSRDSPQMFFSVADGLDNAEQLLSVRNIRYRRLPSVAFGLNCLQIVSGSPVLSSLFKRRFKRAELVACFFVRIKGGQHASKQ